MKLEEKLNQIGFKKINEDFIWNSSMDYQIKIVTNQKDINKSKIDFGDKIKIWNKSTSNLQKNENLTVLECVIRLLEKGYLPENIELEKSWKLGHKGKGRLDILVKNDNHKAFALIECKTWGEEYAKERNNTIEDGGQLFSYFIQEKSSELMILYSSNINNIKIEFISEAIDCKKLKGANNDELFNSWNKSFIIENIFKKETTLYNHGIANLKRKNLKDLDEQSGKGLFNSFAEILRRHAISDKSNAFNKIFNLFVCKIYDEDTKHADEELDFQWKINDNFEQLLKRLSKLYINGLNDYLYINIKEKYFSTYAEFSFIDIYNQESYETNFTIIKELVELLQKYRIRYTQKHQFLGNFFEDLLNSGVKQEAGQFFTPTPLSRFFLKSIPIDKIIQKKIDNKNPDILPYLIDYACGAGHFLTEAIDEYEYHIENVNIKQLIGRTQKRFLAIKDNYYWAKDFIYGIEKDYRLAKTTKIALFLNGDGDAIITNGDGLDNFEKSKQYSGILKTDKNEKYINKFDIVVSNPPFSISGFKKDLLIGNQNFTLFQYLSSKSKEIECLFVERTNQLLNENGYAGIILPLSILNNESRIYTATRKYLLLAFEIIAIIELRDKTFKPTNTTTVGLFLKKREQKEIHSKIEDFKNTTDEQTKKQLNEIIKKDIIEGSEINTNLFEQIIKFINQGRKTVLAYSGEKKDQEVFLGYRYSRSRGKEDLEILKNKSNQISTLLYDTENLLNTKKINSHILANFNNQQESIPEELLDNLKYVETNNLLSNSNLVLNNPSSYFKSDNYKIETNSVFGDIIDKYKQKSYLFSELLENSIQYISGLVYSKKEWETPKKTNKKVITASNIDLKTGKLDIDKKIIYLKKDFYLPENMQPQENDIIISNSSGSLKHLGKCAYVTKNYNDFVIGGFLSIIRFSDEKLSKAFFYRLLSYDFRKYISTLRGQNINNLDLESMKHFKFNLPQDIDKFYIEIRKKEKKLAEMQKNIADMKI